MNVACARCGHEIASHRTDGTCTVGYALGREPWSCGCPGFEKSKLRVFWQRLLDWLRSC